MDGNQGATDQGDSDAREVVIEFLDREPVGVVELARAHPGDVELITAKGFGAFDFTVQALVVLGPTVTVQLAKVIKAHIESKGRIRIKADGIEIEGTSVKDALKVIDELGGHESGDSSAVRAD